MDADNKDKVIPPAKNVLKNKMVETYAEDMAKVIEGGQGGLIKTIIQSEEEHEVENENLSPESKKNKLFMIIGGSCIVVALLILYFFLINNKTINTVPVAQQFTPLIFTDKSNYIEVADMDKNALVQSVVSEVNNSQVKDGGIEGIYLTLNKQVVELRKFISLLQANFTPGSLTYVDDNFLMGFMNNDVGVSAPNTRDFFMLLKVRSMVDVFSNMRSWEKKMFSDLHGFFGVDLSPDTSYLLTTDFQDGIIQNKNARILYGKDGKIVMMYVFANDNSVIIANSEESVREVMLRLVQNEVKAQ